MCNTIQPGKMTSLFKKNIYKKRQKKKNLKEAMAYASMPPIEPSAIVTYCQNFYFKIRRDHQKNSHECRDYESVDEKSLS